MMSFEDRIRATLQDPARRPSPDLEARIMAALPARRHGVGPLVRASWVPLSAAAVLAVVLVAGSSLLPPNGVVPLTTPRSPDPSADAAATPLQSPIAAASVATYPDGIPREIDGEPVLRGDAIAIEAAERTDDRPFLIGGYGGFVMADGICPSEPTTPLLEPCLGGYYLSDRLRGDSLGVRVVVDDASVGYGGGGAQVLRVHVYDERAEACAPDILLNCQHTIVSEGVVWSGP